MPSMIDHPSMSTATFGAIAVRPEPTPYITDPIVNARRRPMMSPILPPTSISDAMTSAYSVIAAWIVVTSVSRSSTSWEIETFMTVLSSTIRNWAAESTSRTFHFEMPATRPRSHQDAPQWRAAL